MRCVVGSEDRGRGCTTARAARAAPRRMRRAARAHRCRDRVRRQTRQHRRRAGDRRRGSAGTPPGTRRSRTTVTERRAVLHREDSRLLGPATPGTGGRRRRPASTMAPVGHAVDASVTRSAAVGDRRAAGCERCVGHHRTEHEPRTTSRQQDVRALAVPPEAGAVRRFSVDERVVVGDHARLPPGCRQMCGDSTESVGEKSRSGPRRA